MLQKLLLMSVSFLFLGVMYPGLSRAGEEVLSFKTLSPVTGPYVGNAHPIQGVPGAGAPWIISEGSGTLNADGDLKVRTRGLVVASTGINPIPTFQVIVSCNSIDGLGNPDVVVVSPPELFPADSNGDSEIDIDVQLPTPCIGPIVFVTLPATTTAPLRPERWVAATGQ
jgi:hypothetical protein